MHNHYPNVLEGSRSVGTGPFVLRGPVRDSLPISRIYDDGATIIHYRIEHTTQPDEWEEGSGIFTDAGGARGLTREGVYSSSNSGRVVDFSSGQKLVRIGGAVVVPTFDEDPAIMPSGTMIKVGDTVKTSDGTTWGIVGTGGTVVEAVTGGTVVEAVTGGAVGAKATWASTTTLVVLDTMTGVHIEGPVGSFDDGWSVDILITGTQDGYFNAPSGSIVIYQGTFLTVRYYDGVWYPSV